MLSPSTLNKSISRISATALCLMLLSPGLAAQALEEKGADVDIAESTVETISDAEMEKALALPMDNLEDVGYTLQRVKQQAIDLYVEATRKKKESKIISKSLVIPHEKLLSDSHYLPLRKAWLVFFVGTMEPLVQLLVHDVHEVETHLSKVKIIRGKKKQFDHVYAQWHEVILGINRHLDVLSDQIDNNEAVNTLVANEARAIDAEVSRAMQLRMRAYAILTEAAPAAKPD